MIELRLYRQRSCRAPLLRLTSRPKAPRLPPSYSPSNSCFLSISRRLEAATYSPKIGLGGHIRTKDRVLFTRQLSTLINAGLPLSRALHSVEDQVTNKHLKTIINSVSASVEGGSSLSAAFAQYPDVFNQIYISLVAAGETSGTLDKALVRLASQQEKDAAIVGKIRSAMIYPAIVVVLIFGVIIMMLVTVVPQVASLYKDLG